MSSTTNLQDNDDNIRWKMIGCRVTEEELQNHIFPMMHECYQLGIIDRDTVASLIGFCLQFWMGHYRMKKHQFDMAQQDIDQEKKKLASIVAEEQAWEKWDNSTPRVMKKTSKSSSKWEKTLREFGTPAPQPEQQQVPQPKPKQQQQQQQPEDLSEPLSPFDVAATGIISEPPVEIIGAEEPPPQQEQPIILQLPFYIYTTSCKIA